MSGLPMMKMWTDFIPIMLFFAVYWASHDLFLATQILMLSMVLRVLYSAIRYRKVSTMQWVSLILILILGGATLYFQNNRFIMWKPTLLYWAMSLGLLFSLFIKKNGLCVLLAKELVLSEAMWQKLTVAWILFFALMGGLNLFVAYHFSEQIWVNFKVFGCLGLTLIFAVIQAVVLWKVKS